MSQDKNIEDMTSEELNNYIMSIPVVDIPQEIYDFIYENYGPHYDPNK